MARRPQEHDRRPTVVTSGPQAGTARAGSTVNKGVQYDPHGKRPQKSGPMSDALSSLVEQDVPAGNLFMPEHLRVIPENPAELFEPLDVRVLCGEKDHVVRWTPEGVELVNHDYVAEEVVATLGGERCPCMKLRDVFTTEPEYVFAVSTAAFDHNRRALSDVTLSEENSSTIVDDIMFRRGKMGATAYLAKEAMGAWLTDKGVAPATDERRMVVVTNTDRLREDTDKDQVGMSFFRQRRLLIFKEGQKVTEPTFGYALWGEDVNTRFAAHLSPVWYDQIRERGFTVDGNLFLGSHEEGDVVLVAPQGRDEAFAVFKSESEKVLADENEQLPWFPQSPAIIPQGGVVVGHENTWEYDDNNYYMIEGGSPRYFFHNEKEAASWSIMRNVKDSFLNPYNNVYEFEQHYVYALGEEFFKQEHYPDLHDVMVECARTRTPPRAVAPAETGWRVIPPAQN